MAKIALYQSRVSFVFRSLSTGLVLHLVQFALIAFLYCTVLNTSPACALMWLAGFWFILKEQLDILGKGLICFFFFLPRDKRDD